MKTNFSPSINIIRDANKDLKYIPTSNTRRIFHQIVNDYKIGTRSFNIIGSYGTGKSAFLLNFERNLQGERRDFEAINGQFGNVNGFEMWNVIGEYTSIVDYFSQSPRLEVYRPSDHQIIEAIDRYYKTIHQENACLVIVIDEFGKFLEYAASHTPEKELYFIQQLAEYANDEGKNILFMTTLHQGFDSYARGLDMAQRQEWEKVKGRLKELTFNEPVELLLHLAAEHIEATSEVVKNDEDIHKVVNIVKASKTFPHRNELTEELARKLYPFDPLAGAVLTLALQQYGQNERSLFTFLNSYDRFGLRDYDTAQNPYYNLACVYDYLLHNYYSFLSTKYNPHYTQWAAIKRAVERIEATFKKDILNTAKIAKTIGLLNIFASEHARIDREFLTEYAKYALGIQDSGELIDRLESFKIIRYVVFRQKYVLFEGTDLDFDLAILDAATKVDVVKDIVTPLKKYFDFPYILAKAVSYTYGTPRFFKFELSDTPVEIPPQNEVDGIINLIFSETLTIEDVRKTSKEINPAILYGLYQNTKQIRDILFEIVKTDYVIRTNQEDRVAVEELGNLKAHQIEALNHYVLHHLYETNDDIVWVFDGELVEFTGQSDFNNFLSQICKKKYPDTPIFRNELVNRHKLSGAISTARRNFIKALTEHWSEEDLGFSKRKYPAEKTIYLTLLQDTGIHRWTKDGYTLAEPQEPSFQKIWQACEEFLDSAKPVRKNLRELAKKLSEKPFKLKKGLIDFWIPIFLFMKREDFALYHEQAYIPDINHEILELVIKKPQKFQLKTFDVQGVRLDLFNKYRALLQQSEGEQFTTTSFIETIKPFLVFYQSLPEYAKQTKKLGPDALRLREVITTATDPEKTFFEEFPRALGYGHLDLKDFDESHLKAYIFQLKNAIKELQTCFNYLVTRIETYLLRESGYADVEFPNYRAKFQKRYHTLKESLLPEHLRVLYKRLLLEIDDKEAWIGSLVQTLLKKKMSEMKDEEEEIVYDRLSHAIQELDNLCDISKLVADPEKEKVVKLEVTSYAEGSQERLLRLPKQIEQQEQKLVKTVSLTLLKVQDRRVRMAILLNLLQQEIHHTDVLGISRSN
jgi:hypothetical protein